MSASLVFLFQNRRRGETYEWWQVLETVCVGAIGAEGALISQHEGDLDDSRDTRSHQRITEDSMNHRADHEVLRMARHSPTGQENDKGGNKIPLWPTIPAPTQPHTQQTRAPPNNTHSRMLQVIMPPRLTPTVLRKGINTAPKRNDQRVEELLAATGATQPELANEQEDREQDTVGDKRAAHDKVSQALAEMVLPTETQGRNAAEEHLRPAHDGHRLAEYAVGDDEDPANAAMDSLCEMQLQVQAEHDLDHHHEHQDVCERRVDVLGESPALMGVAEEVGDDGDNRSDDLDWNMPS